MLCILGALKASNKSPPHLASQLACPVASRYLVTDLPVLRLYESQYTGNTI